MATAEQIKALLKSFGGDDPERFYTLALQMAAHEARTGHIALSQDIRQIVDQIRTATKKARIEPLSSDLEGVIDTDLPGTPMSALVVPPILMLRLRRILQEYRQRDKLKQNGLHHRRKILLVGPPGTGKSLTAKILSHELRMSLFTVQVDRMVTKFMGETGARLRQTFDLIRSQEGVYFFDEFDALGGGRSRENDVGEMRRVLTSLLQFIEQDTSDSLILAATNSPELLDKALFRRFDDVLVYSLPGETERLALIENTLGTYYNKGRSASGLVKASDGLSSADVVQACRDALKDAVLSDRKAVTQKGVSLALADRKRVHER
jgi:SpoVK/Ycf46/Vps4 family AAA+-type ATPase